MTIAINFVKDPRKTTDTALIFVFEGGELGANAKALDKRCAGFIGHAIAKNTSFKGKLGESLRLALPAKAPYAQVVLAGLGKPQELGELKAEEAGGKAFPALNAVGVETAVVLADSHAKIKKIKAEELAARFASGLRLRSYSFDQYKSKKKDEDSKKLKAVDIAAANHTAIAKAYKPLEATIEGVFFARDLVSEPPNVIYPDAYAKRIKAELAPLDVEIEILDDKKMLQLGMGGIMAVGQGSDQKPRMVIMRWKGNTGAPLALVGKGVTFDTGGISIKPSAGMEEMKMDMAGSAAVVGTMKALALRKAKAHVVGIVGLAENMPSGHAYRPADIITSYAGKTIEVLNTDAEGRLVLVDALGYVQKTYKPKAIVDLATLTGAIMVALGYEYCGAFVNSDSFWAKLEKSAASAGEKMWRMPLDEVWRKAMESPVADLQNIAQWDRYGGACTAAAFLQHFIEDKVEWAHLDIAGTAWIKTDRPTVPKYATGYGVRTLEQLVAKYFEK